MVSLYALERAAFVESMRVVATEQGITALRRKRNFYVEQLTGRAYWWAWPWRQSVERWVDGAMHKIAEDVSHGL